MSESSVLVLGAGGHSKVVIATAEAAGIQVAGVFDDREELWGQTVLGHQIVGPIAAAPLTGGERAVIAVGGNQARRRIGTRTETRWMTLIHPSATVHRSVTVAHGTVVFAGAVLQPDSVVGPHAIVNTSATVDHDCHIGAYSHIAPGARLAGNVRVGPGALVGVGATVLPATSVGEWSTIGAGSVVVASVPSGSTVVGVPARQIKL